MTTNETKQLLPVYLINGSDTLKRETVVRRLHQRISQMGDLEFNFDHFTNENATGDSIIAACNTLPFISEVRLVQVDDADRLKKADSEAIIEYLASPTDTTVLCLVADGLAKNTRLYKAISKIGVQAIIDCTPIKRRELPSLVRSMAMNHGVTMTDSAANALIDLVGEDTVAINAELQKLALAHRGSDPINDNEVTSMVSRTAEVKPWEFVDAFSSRNLEKCLLLRSKMNSVSSYSLMAMCVNRIRELITAKCLANRGQSGMLARYLKMPDWRVKNHINWSRAFSETELLDALVQARNTEQAMKSGSNPDDAFIEWCVSVVKKPHQ